MAEETSGHLLDSCSFSSLLWDKGAQIFRRSNRVRGHPYQSIKEWDPNPFANPIILTLWQMFLEMVLWNIWKERNNRIFREDKLKSVEVWQKVVGNMQETIRSRQWDDMARKLSETERRISAGWGLSEADLLGLRSKNKVCHPQSPSLWKPPM